MTDHFRTSPTPPGRHCAPEDLSALLDGEAVNMPVEQIEVHLAQCEGCRARREQLAEVRGLVGSLVTAAPAGAAASAVTSAIDGMGEGAPAGAEDHRQPARLRGRQQRHRVAGIAAAVLLAAGAVSGIVLAAGHGGTSTSARSTAGAAARHSSPGLAPAGRADGGIRGRLQLRPSSDRFGPPIASLTPGDVEAVAIRPGSHGTFTATITLRPESSLTRSATAGLAAGGAAVLGGKPTGSVHVRSPRLVEITGLTRSATIELKDLLG